MRLPIHTRVVDRHLAALQTKRLQRGDEVRNVLTGERFEYRGVDRSWRGGAVVLLEAEEHITKVDEDEFRRSFTAL